LIALTSISGVASPASDGNSEECRRYLEAKLESIRFSARDVEYHTVHDLGLLYDKIYPGFNRARGFFGALTPTAGQGKGAHPEMVLIGMHVGGLDLGHPLVSYTMKPGPLLPYEVIENLQDLYGEALVKGDKGNTDIFILNLTIVILRPGDPKITDEDRNLAQYMTNLAKELRFKIIEPNKELVWVVVGENVNLKERLALLRHPRIIRD